MTPLETESKSVPGTQKARPDEISRIAGTPVESNVQSHITTSSSARSAGIDQRHVGLRMAERIRRPFYTSVQSNILKARRGTYLVQRTITADVLLANSQSFSIPPVRVLEMVVAVGRGYQTERKNTMHTRE